MTRGPCEVVDGESCEVVGGSRYEVAGGPCEVGGALIGASTLLCEDGGGALFMFSIIRISSSMLKSQSSSSRV